VKLLLDTCVLTEIRNAEGSAAVKGFIELLPSDALFLSIITIGEITKGITLLPDSTKKRSLSVWLLGLSSQFKDHILPLNQETAEIWGRCTAGAQQRGFIIPAADGLIAATALQHGLFVATRNTRHFDVTGASVVNPWLAPIGPDE